MHWQNLTKSYVLQRLSLALFCTCLSGCLGGSIGQQVMQSILLKGADKVAESAIDNYERKEITKAQQNTEVDPYTIAFVNSGFEEIKPQVEPLPKNLEMEAENPLPIIQETQLKSVEIWNLLAGNEKESWLEKARMQGSPDVPAKTEWKNCQVATGSTGPGTQVITFLIPPEIGRMHSGQKAMVEIRPASELSLARYNLN